MRNHVRPGPIAKNSRRKTAAERLERHLNDHAVNHGKIKEVDEGYISHDKLQKEELKHLKDLNGEA